MTTHSVSSQQCQLSPRGQIRLWLRNAALDQPAKSEGWGQKFSQVIGTNTGSPKICSGQEEGSWAGIPGSKSELVPNYFFWLGDDMQD